MLLAKERHFLGSGELLRMDTTRDAEMRKIVAEDIKQRKLKERIRKSEERKRRSKVERRIPTSYIY
jgi:hypothetical protein